MKPFALRLIPSTLLAALLLALAPPLEARVLNVKQCYQEMNQWCWAGSSQAILGFYRNHSTQTQIAAYGSDGLNNWNWLWGETSNPTRRGIDLILNNFAQIATNAFDRCLTKTESQTEIDASRPFVVRWGWDSGGGHFVVARGMDNDTVYLMDPWPASGPTVNSYDWVVRGGTHTWTHTLGMQNAPRPIPGTEAVPVTALLLQ